MQPNQPIAKTKKRKKRFLKSRLRRKLLKHVWLSRSLLFIGFSISLYLMILLLSVIFSKIGVSQYIQVSKNFIFTPKDAITSFEGRTNILILGRGGEGHDAPDLTDTIIFSSFKHMDAEIDLVSIPRDIWIPELRTKLNSVYYWGNQKQDGGGIVLSKSVVEEVAGKPVHYAVIVDFSSFKHLIDVMEGIEVKVENSFVDEMYPISGKENDECGGDPEYLCRYERIEFFEGIHLMDGETALKFARSRNAEGDEGTDLARSLRQQKMILAIKEKMTSSKMIFSPKKVIEIIKVAISSFETDLDINEAAILARRVLDSKGKFSSQVLLEDLLINPPISYVYDNQYVFVPKGDSWDLIHGWVDDLLR